MLGPPGSGKTLISHKITEKYGFPLISVEEVAGELSAMAQQDDEMGRLAKESIGSGRVSDDVCNNVLQRVLSRDDLLDGYILVGYPKDVAQAEYIENALNRIGRPLDLVLMIDIDRDELMERRVGRIDCDACGMHYNLYVNPPMVEGVCDMCGARVSRRPRGYEENIANQLREYDVVVQPVLDFFQKQEKLRYVDANGTEEQLWEGVQVVIDSTEPAAVEAPVAETLDQGKVKAKSKARAKKQSAKKKAQPITKKVARKKVVSAPDTDVAVEKKKVVKKKVAKKKVAAKKPAKKAVTKKAATKKPAKKVTSKKVAAKKTAKKAATKKVAAKKVVKKAATKKAASKKKIVKKAAPAKKTVKKTASKKTIRKKTVKKTLKKTAGTSRKVAKKPVRKTAKKKVVTKTPAIKKATTRKKPAKKVAAKKVAKKKTTKKRR